uniref:Uncharacterized protein n=1 Tax=Acrobeloides nanus TaxID=290746 RepID=A0A914DVF9_9BILA
MGFYTIMPYCQGCKCHSYLVEHTWTNKFCLTHENGSLVEEFPSFLEQDHIGISSFNPIITSIGCNGCAELREFDCSNLYTETSYDCLFKDGVNATVDYPEYYQFNDLYYNEPEIQTEKILQYNLANSHVCNNYKKIIFYDYVGLTGTILYVCHGFNLGTDSMSFSKYLTKSETISILADLEILCNCCNLTEAYLQTTYSLHMLSDYTMTIVSKRDRDFFAKRFEIGIFRNRDFLVRIEIASWLFQHSSLMLPPAIAYGTIMVEQGGVELWG